MVALVVWSAVRGALPYLAGLVVTCAVMALISLPLGVAAKRRRSARRVRDLEEYGLIDCLIRFPGAHPGSLRHRWNPGWARLERGIINFHGGINANAFTGNWEEAGAPQTLTVLSRPVQRRPAHEYRKELHRTQKVVAFETDRGEVELASVEESLNALNDRVCG